VPLVAAVNEKGAICLSILFKDCSWDNGWSPALSITSVLLSIMVLLSEPNTGEAGAGGQACRCTMLMVVL
jgi:ubiquitin-protein ligase